MLKKMKIALAFVLMATLVLTSMSFSVMADALTGVQDGSAAMSSAAGSGMTIDIEANGIAGKQAYTDPYYKLTGNTGAYIQPYANNSIHSAFTWEMSFMLPQDSNGISLTSQFLVYTNKIATASTTMTISTSGFNPGGNYNRVVANTSFEYGKWYNLAIVFPYAVANESAASGYDFYKTMYVYVNGEPRGEVTGWNVEGTYYQPVAIQRVRLTSANTPFYIDNLRQYAGSYTPANDAPATLTPVQDGKVATIADGRIGTTERLTADELIANITKDDDTNLRVYSADGALLSGTDIVADNSVLVAAASNGTGMERTYSYYTVAKDAVHLSGLLDGDDDFAMVSAANGRYNKNVIVNGSKDSNDTVYELISVAGTTTGKTDTSAIEPFANIGSGNTQKVLEFSFMLPVGSTGMKVHTQFLGGGNPEPAAWIFNTKGMGIAYSEISYFSGTKFDYNKWYNVAIALPGNDGDDYTGTFTVYINGEKVKENLTLFNNTVTGIRRVRFTPTVSNLDGTSDITYAYVDNLRLVDTQYQNANYDTEDTFTTSLDTDLAADKIFINGETTVAAAKEAITDLNEDSSLKFYNASGAEVKDGNVGDGYTVVVVAKNGTDHVRTLSYYTVENIAGKFVIKTPVYSGEERTVNASFDTINNTGAPVSVSAIMALYDYDGSLKKVTPVVCTTDANGKGSFADRITMTADDDDDYIKFMIWASTTGDITPKMANVVLFDK